MRKKQGQPQGYKKKASPIYAILVIILLCIIAFCLYKLVPYYWNNHKSNQQYSQLSSEYVKTASADAQENAGSKNSTSASGDSEAYKSVSIDFDSLQAINPDIKAWLRFDNLDTIPIDYPVLYNGNNDAYIRTDIYGKYSINGSLFIEELNNPDFDSTTDMSKIIYGHNMDSGVMFGSLRKYRTEDIYKENQYFTIYTPQTDYRYHIFSYFKTTTGSFVYQTGFTSGSQEYQHYIDQLCSNSMIQTGITPASDQPIVLLSTCVVHNTDIRFVLCGVLEETTPHTNERA